MAEQMTVLKLVLDELNLANSISTIDDRIALQKVVCLTQEAGLQLGYGYNWYIRGPYSPALAADYYQLASDQVAVAEKAAGFTLTSSATRAVNKVAAILEVPNDVQLSGVYWLELLASVAFLRRRYRFSAEAAKAKIESSKPLLAPHFDRAMTALTSAGFELEPR